MELWGGLECTVNRVGDRWGDQIQLTGHDVRDDDIALLAELGLSAIRYPILWERISPNRPDERKWGWTDRRVAELRKHKLRVIAGLVHHGSGPHYTDLLADSFAPGLARHARAVAERYPWIDDWTPVNEPVTTARFSALYGLWYPHRRDERAFWLALLNQVDATRLAMDAVRAVNPSARLIQTDDLGRTYGTAPLRDQSAFDNQRRWAGWDLLCGMVIPGHPLHDRLAALGFGERLRAIADAPYPPDVIGINHYLTSDRFLDHRISRYPATQAGGNGRAAYVDVEAIRALTPPPQGLEGALREAWARYGLPLAVTEAHNGCTRDEQMRWMADAWHSARRLRDEGVDVRAVTSWALLGSNGWDTLLTRPGRYETGAFDVTAGTPRPTALARLLPRLAKEGGARPVAGQGWWTRPIRLTHPVVPRPAGVRHHRMAQPAGDARPILICGATGTLGQAIARACRHRDLPFVLTGREQLELADPGSIARALDAYRPAAAINAAGWVRVDDAEEEADACHAANAVGTAALSEACARRDIPTVTFSTDLVFDGQAGRAYHEEDRANPLNAYGRSKLDAERAVRRLDGRHLIVRTAAFFSPFDPHNFAWHAAEALKRGAHFAAASDHVVSPTYVPHLADAVLDLLIDEATGLWHLTNGSPISWSDFAAQIAVACRQDGSLVDPVPGSALGWRAPRPKMSALDSNRGRVMPSLERAIGCFAAEMAHSRR